MKNKKNQARLLKKSKKKIRARPKCQKNIRAKANKNITQLWVKKKKKKKIVQGLNCHPLKYLMVHP